MVITKIEQQKKRPNRSSLFVDGKFYCGLNNEVIVQYELKKGKEIGAEEMEEIEKKELYYKAWDYVLRYVGIRMRSEYEIKTKLKEKEYSDHIVDLIVEKAREYKLVDDRQFAEVFTRDRMQFKQKGKRALSFDLNKKGIDKEIIQDVVASVAAEDEENMAVIALEKKYKNRDLKNKKEKERAVRFLSSRGFSWDIIKKSLEKMMKM